MSSSPLSCCLLFRKWSKGKLTRWTSDLRRRLLSSSSSTGNNHLDNVRVRFAPSPTGLLHLGGFRTALINYLFALKNGGRFILRIEDTDQSRLVPEAVGMIEKDLSWLGLTSHEGPSSDQKTQYGPYYQSQRLSLYHDSVDRLLASGHAYECFCSETRLDLIRRDAMRLRQVPKYDNKCRDLTREQVKAKKVAGEKHTIRFKLQLERMTFSDLIHGSTTFDLREHNNEGDFIIIKSDGFPTYHFANVVDDHYMAISHVLRGVEWQVSTPKHLQMYRAFNWEPPVFGHLPIVVNKDGSKLSKRQGDISIRHYRDEGYYPTALANFVTKSGGGFEDHSVERNYTHEELSKMFDISKVNTAQCRLDFELLSKLNQVELINQANCNLGSLVSSIKQALAKSSTIPNPNDFSEAYLETIAKWCPPRITRIEDLFNNKEFEYLWTTPSHDATRKISSSPEVLANFSSELETFLGNSNTSLVDLSNFIKEFSNANGLKFKDLMTDLRLMMCGLEKGPPLIDLITLIGRDAALQRMKSCLSSLKQEQRVRR